MKSSNRQRIRYVSPVYRRGGTKQGTETGSWVEASIWTERMLAALENGVKGGKWFSLIDKVSRLRTLENCMAEGCREQGIGRCGRSKCQTFWSPGERNICRSRSHALKSGSYPPRPVKRVEIAKGPGKTRRWEYPWSKTVSCRQR